MLAALKDRGQDGLAHRKTGTPKCALDHAERLHRFERLDQAAQHRRIVKPATEKAIRVRQPSSAASQPVAEQDRRELHAQKD